MSVAPVGAPECRRARRARLLGLARVIAISSVVVVVGACSTEDDETPATLIGGSPVRALPVRLEGIDGPAVLTAVSVVDVARLERGSAPERCVHGSFVERRIDGPVVTRTGVDTVSVTVEDASGVGLLGCIDSVGPRDENRRWCGTVYGRVSSGRLADPRLDILCVTRDAEPIASAWVEAGPDARYVVVSQTGYAEAYEVAAGLPVRIASTRDVDTSRGQATFEITEHDAGGRLLRSYRLEAYVAG